VTSESVRAACLVVLAALPLVQAHPQSADFVELFDGTLDNWRTAFTDADNIAVVDGVLRIEGPRGWLRSRQRYGDFRLEIEFRWLSDDADSGVFLRANADQTFARGWPDGSYQVQLRNPAGQSQFPPIGFVFRHRMPDGPIAFDDSGARAAALPTGEWQTLAIELMGERVAVWLNGTLITRAAGIAVSRNFIGLQAEAGALEFRSIRIRER
jgi:3-keto-disaccharide hydrolase